ncbi:MAG TPA: HlyD family efflux transporter periplasmic adaptor subunit [Candidatus Acidoferrum sp.]|nr:HlyD family efflux transporter periplasmic adaptor subunit [Candidatus Acidoferrum sp.]
MRGDLRERILLTGELVAERADRLTVPMTRLWQLSIRWLAEDGSEVAEGDRLVEFDDSALLSEVEQKRLKLKQALSERAAQQATDAIALADKQFELARQRTLLDKAELLAQVPRDLLTERDWQERQLERERVRVAHDKAEADLDAHRRASALALQVKEIEAEKNRRDLDTTEKGIAALTLRAPRGGILLVGQHPWEGRKFEAGDVTQPGWTVVELPDLGAMRVEAHLSDVDDGRLAAGAPGRCTLDAFPDLPFDGTVVELAPVAQAMAPRSLRRGFRVVVSLARTDPERMRPGMSVKVEVTGALVRGALLAPRAGLDLSGDEPAALLSDGRRAAVVLGPCDAHRCVVAGGLVPGQELRTRGQP